MLWIELRIQSERRPELWHIKQLRVNVGKVSVNTTDKFILAWMELQANMMEYVNGEYIEPTSQAIMQVFHRERTGRTENADATMFVKMLKITKFAVDLKFKRDTALAMDFFMVPKGTIVELQGGSALQFPKVRLEKVLGDGDSILNRFIDRYKPRLKAQIEDNLLSLGLDNFEGIIGRIFDSTNQTLEQERANLHLKQSGASVCCPWLDCWQLMSDICHIVPYDFLSLMFWAMLLVLASQCSATIKLCRKPSVASHTTVRR